MKRLYSHHPRAFGVLELLIVLVILAVVGAFVLPKMLAPSPNGSSTQTTSIISGEQRTADTSTALSIADNVYESAQATGVSAPILYSQYASSATTFSSITSVTPTSGGALFTFTDGVQICVSTPLSSGPAPSVFTCA